MPCKTLDASELRALANATTAARHEADETREEKGRASDATLRHAMVRAAAISEPVTWCDACEESIRPVDLFFAGWRLIEADITNSL